MYLLSFSSNFFFFFFFGGGGGGGGFETHVEMAEKFFIFTAVPIYIYHSFFSLFLLMWAYFLFY